GGRGVSAQAVARGLGVPARRLLVAGRAALGGLGGGRHRRQRGLQLELTLRGRGDGRGRRGGGGLDGGHVFAGREGHDRSNTQAQPQAQREGLGQALLHGVLLGGW